MNVKPIKSTTDHENALARIESLWDAKENTPESDELEVLCILVEHFESEHYSTEKPHPIEAIKFRMEQDQLTQNDLIPFIGHKSKVSEVLNKKRKLNLNMIRELHSALNIPLEILVSDYDLTSKE